PLPFSAPERLFAIREVTSERDASTRSVNALHYHEWRRSCDCFEGVALAEYVQLMNLAGIDEPERTATSRGTPPRSSGGPGRTTTATAPWHGSRTECLLPRRSSG